MAESLSMIITTLSFLLPIQKPRTFIQLQKLPSVFSLLHRACCRVTQLLYQPMHIYKIYKTLHIKTLKTLQHVSVLRPSSGSYNFLAKVTLCDYF
jgi:hypothetical protein